MINNRIEILQNGEWKVSHDIREGDTFRLYDRNGDRIIDRKGRKQWIAASEVFNRFGDSVINVY